MSFTVLYRDTGSVIGSYADREDAVRDAVTVALERPDLSFIVGLTEVADDGMPVTPFISASDLLAANDPDAVTVADEYDPPVRAAGPDAGRSVESSSAAATAGMMLPDFIERVAAETELSEEDAATAVNVVISAIEAKVRGLLEDYTSEGTDVARPLPTTGEPTEAAEATPSSATGRYVQPGRAAKTGGYVQRAKSPPKTPTPTPRVASSVMVGESVVGEGNEVAHIDVLIGPKDGPVGRAFANALVNQSEGHTKLLALVAPNLPAKPDTIISNKVTIKGATEAVQMFGPAQAAVARAVVDSVRDGVIPSNQVDNLCVVAGVFVHSEAADIKKIFDWNYEATKQSIARALGGEPAMQRVLDGAAEAPRQAAGAEA